MSAASPPDAADLFDAFLWIEARRQPKQDASSQTKLPHIFKPHNTTVMETRILWTYPQDISRIATEFPDLPQFCFPDLNSIHIQNPGTAGTGSEQFTFTLTGINARRMYGICFRMHFRGVGRRYAVGRRCRHCLCLLSSSPFTAALQALLQQLHAVALLEEKAGTCRRFLQQVYEETARSRRKLNGKGQRFSRIKTSDLYATYYLTVPIVSPNELRHMASITAQTPIIPLFEVLGVERFFKLLSALLCEKRILFVADSIETLTGSVLAAADMLYPFSWHHVFIPLLPEKLVNYLLAPMPYMIGIRRHVLASLRRDAMDNIIVVDVDSGDIKLHGSVNIRDLIGDAGNMSARQKAVETIDHVKAKMKKIALAVQSSSQTSSRDSSSGSGNSSSTSKSGKGYGDLMAVLLHDIKTHVVATRPSNSYSLSTVLKGGALKESYGIDASAGCGNSSTYRDTASSGTSRKSEEARLQWLVEAEKQLRETLITFFVYLFGDMYEYVKPTALLMLQQGQMSDFNSTAQQHAASRKPIIPPSGMSNAELRRFDFNERDMRSLFDWNDLFLRRSQVHGDSKYLLEFFMEFLHSQMFEQFCAKLVSVIQERLSQQGLKHTSKYTYRTMLLDSPSSEALDLSEGVFFAAVKQLQELKIAMTVPFARQIVTRCSAVAGAQGEVRADFFSGGLHEATVQLTSGANALQAWELKIDHDERFFSFDSMYPHTVLYARSAGASAAGGSVTNANVSNGVDNALYSKCFAICRQLDTVMSDISESSKFRSIMRTIKFRLDNSRSSSSRGSSGLGGIRALLLLRVLLLRGPISVVTAALDLIPVIRGIRHAGTSKKQAFQYIAMGTYMDAYSHAGIVLNLLLDQKKLMVQRKFHAKWQGGYLPYMNPVISHSARVGRSSRVIRRNCVTTEQELNSSRSIPPFSQVHRLYSSKLQDASLQTITNHDIGGETQVPSSLAFVSNSSTLANGCESEMQLLYSQEQAITCNQQDLSAIESNANNSLQTVRGPPRRSSALKSKPLPPLPPRSSAAANISVHPPAGHIHRISGDDPVGISTVHRIESNKSQSPTAKFEDSSFFDPWSNFAAEIIPAVGGVTQDKVTVLEKCDPFADDPFGEHATEDSAPLQDPGAHTADAQFSDPFSNLEFKW